VSAAFSLAPYASTSNIPYISGNSSSLKNAYLTAASLVNPVSGTFSSILASPNCSSSITTNCKTVQKINTLANLAASCHSSTSSSSPACAQWLALGNQSTDTLSVLFQLASQPALRNNGPAVFNALTPASFFTPVLTSPPNDWSLALSFNGGGLNGPVAIAIDANGQVWVTNSLQGGSLSAFAPDGTAISPNTGYTGNGLSGPRGLAVDQSGHVWVANWAQGSGSTVSIFNNDGSATTGSPIASTTVNGLPSLSGPIAIALAPSGTMWVANYGNSTISAYLPSQQLQAGGLYGGGLSFPVNVAVDNNGNVWTVNNTNSDLSEFSPVGVPIKSGAYTNSSFNSPYGIALTSAGDIWVANQFNSTLVKVFGGSTPPANCPTTLSSGNTGCVASVLSAPSLGLNGPISIAIDGSGNIHVINYWGSSLSTLNSNGSLISNSRGLQTPDMLQPIDLAVDSSGNVWVVNYGSNTLTKFIGIAAPVVTPKQGQPVPL
jgi:sugar lactone lactonase YvrE